MKLVAKEKEFVGGSFLKAGTHDVTIKAVSMATSKSTQWSDETPQLKVEFADAADTKHTEWYQLKGFMKFSDLSVKEKKSNLYESRSSLNGNEDYAVLIATGERIEDPARSAKCMDKLNELAGTCGFEAGSDLDASDLEGSEISITIKLNEQGKTRIHYANKITA